MRSYAVYRNIRKRAVIFGLPVSFFAIQMVSIIGSLLIVIFSFGFVIILALLFFNVLLYITFLKMSTKNMSLKFSNSFPHLISNKQTTLLNYDKD